MSKTNTKDKSLWEHLVALLKGGNTHVNFETAIKGLLAARATTSIAGSTGKLRLNMSLSEIDKLRFDFTWRKGRAGSGFC
jgi:hypothetical protein